MLSKKYMDRYADVLIWGMKAARAGQFKKNDIISIHYNLTAIGLTEILHAKLLAAGYNAVPRLEPTPTMERNFFLLSNSKQLSFIPPGERELYSNLNGSIFIRAPESITHLRDIDPKRIGRFDISRKRLRDIRHKREAAGLFGWTLCVFPTDEMASHAGMSLKEYTDQIVKACFLNRREPVREWQDIFRKAISIKKWLNSMDVDCYHVESENIDLEITPGAMRKWIGLSGHNIPSFELFTSPDWRGTRGVYYADQPSFRSGNYVKGLRLEFRNGKAVKIQAEEGENFVKKQLSMDQGAGRLGEFSLTDRRFSKINRFMANTLFDENMGGKHGNCHVALGFSFSDAYSGKASELTEELKKKLGFNDSALHWDLVNTEKKRVTARLVSGKRITIYENGSFAL